MRRRIKFGNPAMFAGTWVCEAEKAWKRRIEVEHSEREAIRLALEHDLMAVNLRDGVDVAVILENVPRAPVMAFRDFERRRVVEEELERALPQTLSSLRIA